MKICIVIGTRPEVIKLSSVVRECERRGQNYFIIHTNQHYTDSLDKIFFQELNLPLPKYNLNIGSGTHGYQTGRMLIELEKVLVKEEPDIVLVQGDTNTVLAGSLAAVKLKMRVGHIEAGLRSYDKTMPEEINRILVDNCSSFLFTPTEESKEILIKESFDEKIIYITGNTVVDAVYQNIEIANIQSTILKKLELKKEKYILLTCHRQENVDNASRLRNIIDAMHIISSELDLPIIFPVHPRTNKKMNELKLINSKFIKRIEPVGYLDFLKLQKNAKLIYTDSGGVQEEACILKVPCVTLRDNTERPETLRVKSNILAGTTPDGIISATREILEKPLTWNNPFGDGNAAVKIIDIVCKNLN